MSVVGGSIMNNQGSDGGGVRVQQEASLTMHGTVIADNGCVPRSLGWISHPHQGHQRWGALLDCDRNPQRQRCGDPWVSGLLILVTGLSQSTGTTP